MVCRFASWGATSPMRIATPSCFRRLSCRLAMRMRSPSSRAPLRCRCRTSTEPAPLDQPAVVATLRGASPWRTSMIAVKDIAFVRYQVTDLDRMEAFLTDFGLQRAVRTESALYMRAADTAHHVHISELGPEQRDRRLRLPRPERCRSRPARRAPRQDRGGQPRAGRRAARALHRSRRLRRRRDPRPGPAGCAAGARADPGQPMQRTPPPGHADPLAARAVHGDAHRPRGAARARLPADLRVLPGRARIPRLRHLLGRRRGQCGRCVHALRPRRSVDRSPHARARRRAGRQGTASTTVRSK